MCGASEQNDAESGAEKTIFFHDIDSRRAQIGQERAPVYTAERCAIPGNVLILFACHATAEAFPVKNHVQTITELHTIHHALAQQTGHFVDIVVGQHAGRALG
ncbi:hypothetical protein D3C72_1933620 [compost metagenome]